jgi:hypothetical protein
MPLTAETKTYTFPFTTGGFFLPPGTTVTPQNILDASGEARQVVVSVNLFTSSGDLVRVVASPVLPPANGIPFVIIAFDQGKASAQSPGFAQIVAPDVPVSLIVPPNRRLYASGRGAVSLPAVLQNGFIALSITYAASVEPAADGQSKRIVDGVRQALIDTIQPGIVAAARALGVKR